MQTFLPYANFTLTAKCLDYRRLGKQRVEARQILDVIVNNKKAWSNHPAVTMWRGYEIALMQYFNVISKEWVSRGYKHNMGFFPIADTIVYPKWLGDKEFHLSHQSNLVRKLPEHYGPLFPGVRNDLPYIWPV